MPSRMTEICGLNALPEVSASKAPARRAGTVAVAGITRGAVIGRDSAGSAARPAAVHADHDTFGVQAHEGCDDGLCGGGAVADAG